MEMLTPGRMYPPLPVHWWTLAIGICTGEQVFPVGTFLRPGRVPGTWLTCSTYSPPPPGIPQPTTDWGAVPGGIWVPPPKGPLQEAFFGHGVAVDHHRGLLQDLSPDGLALVTEIAPPVPLGPNPRQIPTWPTPLIRVPLELLFPDLGDVDPSEVSGETTT